ncbi:unnamed protein product [Cladocopium goreaui]|uniref:Uncharacterized protein n=1 Tax=Cladocopium goreaui TaxID=2562237 RepID=A0A9P1BED4_9DINO|nr:unnamed protein product [Cladocopium goreaui]
MPTTPVPGFITKKEASEKFARSHRQLTRDIADAMKVQNAKVLDHCRLRTEEGEVIDGLGMTPELIDQLCLDGKNPVWYFRTSWLEKQYGRRGHVRQQRPGSDHVASSMEEGSEPSARPELVHVLRERIRGLEQDKQDLRDEMKIKNQQIADRVEREKETNALVRDLHTLMADMQQRLLPMPSTHSPRATTSDTPAASSTPSQPRSTVTEIEVDQESPTTKTKKEGDRKQKKANSKKSGNRKRNAARTKLGKDHLTLADWPIGVATYQQRTQESGEQRDYAAFSIEREDGTRQKVTLESPSRVGLPTAGDKDVLIALLFLAKEQGFASDIVRFVPWQLLQVMGWPRNQKSLLRLKTSLKRLKALTATYESAWYSRRTRTVEACLITGILAEVKVVFRKGRRASDATPESYVQWTRHVYTSLQEGSLIDLDLDLYFSCKRPAAKDLLRHLNKVWHGGRKPKPYARDLKELACGHLGMTDSKDLKRNFDQLVKELEARNYVRPTASSVRYKKIRPGIWRVHFELHPDQLRTKKQVSPAETPQKTTGDSAASEAERLVCLYHRQRFDKETYAPQQREVDHAATLLVAHRMDTLVQLLPAVAKTVKQTFQDQDVFFGAAVPYFEKAIADARRREKVSAQKEQQREEVGAKDGDSANQKDLRQKRRQRLLEHWAGLKEEQQQGYLEKSIDAAASSFDRRRLARSQDITNPSNMALDIMARHHKLSKGESM